VQEFVEEFRGDGRKRIARHLKALIEHGPTLPYPLASHIEGKLWELRPDPIRLFYYVASSEERLIVILHGYRKQTATTPRREIEKALARMAAQEERIEEKRRREQRQEGMRR